MYLAHRYQEDNPAVALEGYTTSYHITSHPTINNPTDR
jgi:hypothetical protein